MVDKPSMPLDRAKTVHDNENYTLASSNDNDEHHREDRSASAAAAHQDRNEGISSYTRGCIELIALAFFAS